MSFLEQIHGGYVYSRRLRVLGDHLAEMLPGHARVLDVGSGDGLLANLIRQRRPDLEMIGIDVLIRDQTHIPIQSFDGKHIPFNDESFDIVMFIDVLHHTEDPCFLLGEAVRVARQGLVIKDHTLNGFLAGPTLRFMDRIGNQRHGVTLPYNYWTRKQWLQAFEKLGLKTEAWTNKLGLYPLPANWVFDRSLHFVARLDRKKPTGSVSGGSDPCPNPNEPASTHCHG
jgi:SAM-dependent methyltransferase